MQTHCSQASLLVPCNYEQAMLAVVAFDLLNAEMSETSLAIIEGPDNDHHTILEKILRHAYTHHPDYVRGQRLDSYCWGFDVSVDGDLDAGTYAGLYLGSNNCFNSEHAAVFVQALLKAYRILDLVEIEVARICQAQSVDRFGGQALVVSKDFIRYSHCDQFMQAERVAHSASERYYMCSIVRTDGDGESRRKLLLQCRSYDDPDILLRNRYESVDSRTKHISNNRWCMEFDDGTIIKDPVISEIEPYEFMILKKHLPVESEIGV